MPHITITTSIKTLDKATPAQADNYCQLLRQVIADLFPEFAVSVNRDDSIDHTYLWAPCHIDSQEILRIAQAIADAGHLEHAGYWEQAHIRYSHRYDETSHSFVVKDVLTGRELKIPCQHDQSPSALPYGVNDDISHGQFSAEKRNAMIDYLRHQPDALGFHCQ